MHSDRARRSGAIRTFTVLALLGACADQPPSRSDAGTSDGVGASVDAASTADASEDPGDASVLSPDAGALEDSSAASDAGGPTDGGAAALPISAPGRSRISVWGRKICALDAQRDVVCWGSTNVSARQSAAALRGPFRSVQRCADSGFAPVCAVAENGTLTCAGWLGDASGYVHDPQECTPPVTAAAFSCGSFGNSSIAVLNPQGALFRLTSLCDLNPEITDAGPFERLEMVDDNLCALDRAHNVHCFPSQLLPDGGRPPEEPVIEDKYIDLAVGEIATCGVTREGRVRCWNYLGVENTANDGFAVSAAKRGKVARLATERAGGDVLCALFEDGSVGCSSGFERQALRMVPKSEPWLEIAVDHETLCGVRADRSVACLPVHGGCTAADCGMLMQVIAPPDGLRVPE